jgi:AhpD family alkylhydroperoxidase
MTLQFEKADRIKEFLELDRVPVLFEKLAPHQAYLSAVWDNYVEVMATGEIDPPTKELMGLSIAVAKPSEYMVEFQRLRVRARGWGPEEELEALAATDHFEGFDAFAHAIHVDSEWRPRQLLGAEPTLLDHEDHVTVPYVLESDDPRVQEVYAEIEKTLGMGVVPNIFKAMAHQPALLKAKWDGYKAVMTAGKLSTLAKELIAVSVSAVNACYYCVDAHSTAGRRLGLSDAGLVEAACVVDLFTGLCSIATGLGLRREDVEGGVA